MLLDLLAFEDRVNKIHQTQDTDTRIVFFCETCYANLSVVYAGRVLTAQNK